MSQAVKLPRSCLLGLLIIPLTYYYISMYSYSSCDTFEDYQMGNFVQEVCISVFQIQKKMNMTLEELPSKIFFTILGFSSTQSNYTKSRALWMFQPR